MTSPLTLLHDTFRLLTFRSPGPAVRDAWPAYLAFVTLTAPPALLYAIPVERFMTPSAASVTNAWFLAVVAAWRVGLWEVAGSDRCDSCGFRDDAYVFLKIRAAFPGKAG